MTIPINSSNIPEGITISSLIFTCKLEFEQTVTVTGVDDTEVDDDVAFYVIIGVSESNDLNYSEIDPEDIPYENNDQEIIKI